MSQAPSPPAPPPSPTLMPVTPSPVASSPAARSSLRSATTIVLGVIAIIALLFAVLAGYALSERGLPFIVARIVAQSGGRISVEGATGSIAGTMRFRRIAWRGTDASVVADDVAVDWSPGALWRSRVSIQGLGARHVEISLKARRHLSISPTPFAPLSSKRPQHAANMAAGSAPRWSATTSMACSFIRKNRVQPA